MRSGDPRDKTTTRAARSGKPDKRALPGENDAMDILGRADMGVILLDEKLRPTYLNAEAASLLDKTQGEPAGGLPGDVLPESLLKRLMDEMHPAIRERTNKSIEVFLTVPLDIWLSCRLRPYQNGFILFLQDISERKKAEEELRESQRMLATLMSNLPGISYRCRNDRDWTMEYVSDGCLKLTGYHSWELVGNKVVSYNALIDPDYRDPVWNTWQASLAMKEKVTMEYPIRTRDGGTKWVWEQGQGVYSEKGEVIAVEGFITDITQRMLTEEELSTYREHLEGLVRERTLELERKNTKLAEEIAQREKVEGQLLQTQKIEALGSFAGGIAHDLNNILYPIIINTEMLLDEADPGTSSYEILKQNLEAAYRQRDLVKQILSFSRQGIQRLNPISMAPLLDSTLDFIRSSLPSTIEIRRSIDAPSDTIMADSTQMQQVIMNLCKNAADAMEEQRGTIVVGLADRHIEHDPARPEIQPGEYLELSVCDTGRGIPKDIATKIFDPFFTTKEVGKGSGMGLSVVHGILKKHGGFVTVESEAGKGSCFRVSLPLIPRREQGAPAPVRESAAEEGKGKILLVDDERNILSSLGNLLGKMGYTVESAQDGLEAYDLFRKHPDEFKLVITDLVMPEMTGIELGRKLMSLKENIPVILCTGYNDAIDEEEALALGFDGLLLKPAGSGDLKSAIQRAMGSS